MNKFIVASILLLTINISNANETGVISLKSEHSVSQTIDKLEKILLKKGVTIFARINHAKGAKNINATLRDTELLIFGNPKLGTPLMQSKQLMGLDLPLKALAWQDKNGVVWLSYNNPVYLSNRHSVDNKNKIITKMSKILKKITALATAK